MIDKNQILYLLTKNADHKGMQALKGMVVVNSQSDDVTARMSAEPDSLLDRFLDTTVQLILTPTHYLDQQDNFQRRGYSLSDYRVDPLVNSLASLAVVKMFPGSGKLSTPAFSATSDVKLFDYVLSPVQYNGFVDEINRQSDKGTFSSTDQFKPVSEFYSVMDLPIVKLNDGRLYCVGSTDQIKPELCVMMDVTINLDTSLSTLSRQISVEEALLNA